MTYICQNTKIRNTWRGVATAAKENCILLMSKEGCEVHLTLRQKFKYEGYFS